MERENGERGREARGGSEGREERERGEGKRAHASATLKFCLKRRKYRKNFCSRLRRAEKIGHFCQSKPFCLPLEKNPAGAHGDWPVTI